MHRDFHSYGRSLTIGTMVLPAVCIQWPVFLHEEQGGSSAAVVGFQYKGGVSKLLGAIDKKQDGESNRRAVEFTRVNKSNE